jgi:phosphatidylserine decarboxylase
MNSTNLKQRAFVLLQYLVPQHLLSRLLGALALCRIRAVKNFLIRHFIERFGVDMSEAIAADAAAYPHFNAFFTRALREGVRPLDEGANAVVSPADGAVSQIGRIESGRIVQAKGHWFSAAELLGSDSEAQLFDQGSFATVYLSPRDYHRVHMPLQGSLRGLRYIPGKLFSVNQTTAEGVPGLFARNERLVCLLDTEQGPMAMVLVGAMIVAGIETVWTGPVAPAGHSVLELYRELSAQQRTLDKGAEMGRFQLGSTVILLLPRAVANWESSLNAGSPLRMGQRIATLAGADS